MMEEKKTEAKAEAARRAKGKRAITIRNQWEEEETEICFKEEVAMQLKKELEMKREIVEDNARREDQLRQVHRHKDELRKSLQTSVSKKSSVEAQLEKAEAETGEVLQEIEAIRRERDLLRQRIDGLIRRDQGSCCYRQFTAHEVAEATSDADSSEHRRISAVAGGVVSNTDVVVLFKKAYGEQTTEEFQAQQASRRSEALLRANIQEAQKMMEEKKAEAKAEAARRAKAKRAITIRNRRKKETEICFKEEVAKQKHLKEEQEMKRAEMREIVEDIGRSEDQLRQVRRLEDELRTSLQTSVSKKSSIEAQIEKAETETGEVLQEIEAIRRERDQLRQMIDGSRTGQCICRCRQFTAPEVADAICDASEHRRISAVASGVVWKGTVCYTDVAVKFKKAYSEQSKEEFQAQKELLCQLRHPHLVINFDVCMDKRCIISEYMHHRSLLDVLRSKPDLLSWQDRIRIAGEICSAVGFLHASQPKPTVHGNLKATNVLLDQNLVAKLSDFRVNHGHCPSEREVWDDVKNLGLLLLLLVTGSEKVQARDDDVRRAMEGEDLSKVLDRSAGDWPLDIAEEFVRIGLRYSTKENGDDYTGRTVSSLMGEVEGLRTRAKEIMVDKTDRNIEEEACMEKKLEACNIFLCPILQEVMKQPYVAADGFSYELEAIQEWFSCGNETSPVTKLKLNHKLLTPNIVLRSLVNDWHDKILRSH